MDPDSGRCPGLEDALPPFAAALRATCPVSAEGYPAEEVRVSPSSILRPFGCLVGRKFCAFCMVNRALGRAVLGGSLTCARVQMLMLRNSCAVHTSW